MKKTILALAIIGATSLGVATQAGAVTGPIRYGGTTPRLAVPEPGTWAMMLIGFASLGMAIRVRRARTA